MVEGGGTNALLGSPGPVVCWQHANIHRFWTSEVPQDFGSLFLLRWRLAFIVSHLRLGGPVASPMARGRRLHSEIPLEGFTDHFPPSRHLNRGQGIHHPFLGRAPDFIHLFAMDVGINFRTMIPVGSPVIPGCLPRLILDFVKPVNLVRSQLQGDDNLGIKKHHRAAGLPTNLLEAFLLGRVQNSRNCFRVRSGLSAK